MAKCGNDPHVPCPFCGEEYWPGSIDVDTRHSGLDLIGSSSGPVPAEPTPLEEAFGCCGVKFCDPGMLPRCATLTIAGMQTSVVFRDEAGNPLTYGCCDCDELDGEVVLRSVGPSNRGWSAYLCSRCFPSVPIVLWLANAVGHPRDEVFFLLGFYGDFYGWQPETIPLVAYYSEVMSIEACVDLTTSPVVLHKDEGGNPFGEPSEFGVPSGLVETPASCVWPDTMTIQLGLPSEECFPAENPCCPCHTVDGGGEFLDCQSQPTRWHVRFTDIEDGNGCCPGCEEINNIVYDLKPVLSPADFVFSGWFLPQPWGSRPLKCAQEYAFNEPRGIETTRICTNRFFSEVRLEVNTFKENGDYQLRLSLAVAIKDRQFDAFGLWPVVQDAVVATGPDPAAMCNLGPTSPFTLAGLFPEPCNGQPITATIWADNFGAVEKPCVIPLEHRCHLCQCTETGVQFLVSHDPLPQVGASPPVNSCPGQSLTLSLPSEFGFDVATEFSCLWLSPNYEGEPCDAQLFLACTGPSNTLLELTLSIGQWSDTVLMSSLCADYNCELIGFSSTLKQIGQTPVPYTIAAI
jgi:hypothetical protein